MAQSGTSLHQPIEDEDSVEVLQTHKGQFEQRLRGTRFTTWGWLLSILIGSLISYLLFSGQLSSYAFEDNLELISYLIPRLLTGSMFAASIYGYSIFMIRLNARSNLRRTNVKLVQLGAIELQEQIEENFFTNLFK